MYTTLRAAARCTVSDERRPARELGRQQQHELALGSNRPRKRGLRSAVAAASIPFRHLDSRPAGLALHPLRRRIWGRRGGDAALGRSWAVGVQARHAGTAGLHKRLGARVDVPGRNTTCGLWHSPLRLLSDRRHDPAREGSPADPRPVRRSSGVGRPCRAGVARDWRSAGRPRDRDSATRWRAASAIPCPGPASHAHAPLHRGTEGRSRDQEHAARVALQVFELVFGDGDDHLERVVIDAEPDRRDECLAVGAV